MAYWIHERQASVTQPTSTTLHPRGQHILSTVKELRETAKSLNITGASRMLKADLEAAILSATTTETTEAPILSTPSFAPATQTTETTETTTEAPVMSNIAKTAITAAHAIHTVRLVGGRMVTMLRYTAAILYALGVITFKAGRALASALNEFEQSAIVSDIRTAVADAVASPAAQATVTVITNVASASADYIVNNTPRFIEWVRATICRNFYAQLGRTPSVVRTTIES